MTETNEERLKSVEELLKAIIEMGDGSGIHGESIEVCQWLIERAERATELEEEVANLTNLNIEDERDYYLLREENDELQEALKYIAKHDFIGEGDHGADMFANDFISKARTALDNPT